MSGLLGRAQECAALDAAVARARGGEGGSLLVTGGRGHQIINQSPDAPVRAPLFGGTADASQAA